MDLSAPARLLADPFVASLPENLGSTSAHTALAAVLARAATAARAGDRDGLVAQLQRAAMLLEEHRGHVATGEAPASDLVALAALDVVRLRAATLLPAAPADAAR